MWNFFFRSGYSGEKEAAITAYRQSLVIDSTRVVALFEQGQLEDAIAAYHQAINLDSRNANAYFNLAIALQQQGKRENRNQSPPF
jgi:tetratricopeptide (TPR) repeat protein